MCICEQMAPKYIVAALWWMQYLNFKSMKNFLYSNKWSTVKMPTILEGTIQDFSHIIPNLICAKESNWTVIILGYFTFLHSIISMVKVVTECTIVSLTVSPKIQNISTNTVQGS